MAIRAIKSYHRVGMDAIIDRLKVRLCERYISANATPRSCRVLTFFSFW